MEEKHQALILKYNELTKIHNELVHAYKTTAEQNKNLMERLTSVEQQMIEMKKGTSSDQIEATNVEFRTDSDSGNLAEETEWIRIQNKKKMVKKPKAKRARIELSSADSSPPPLPNPVALEKPKAIAAKIPSPPPIMVSEINNINELNALSKEKDLMEKITIKLIGEKSVKINTIDGDTYRKTTEALSNKGLSWFTYENKQARPIRVMAKKLHHSHEPNDIREYLKEKGFKITNVDRRLSVKRDVNKEKIPLNMFMLTFEHNENIENIYKIKKIMSSIVEIEPLKTNKLIPQCKRCQSYGHTQKYCHKETRCVKCLKKHLTKDCDKLAEEKPKCVNCGLNHAANFRGCVVAKVLQSIKKKNGNVAVKVQQNKNKDSTKSAPARFVEANTSYASVLVKDKAHQVQQPKSNNLQDTLQIILEKLNSFDERLKRLEYTSKGAIPKQ